MSSIRTENLVILFTDIAGFTEATSLQSREQNQTLLDRHNAIMLPIVKRFRGRHIKSIGDALLLVFRSPTDAMRCAMAMQDALHAYNLGVRKEEQIHVRIAASLGEVRVTKNDIFGEPVNVTSRIEHITPADEIYFSEAVYLAMNKAEVPAIEIGTEELKGISKPVKIFGIPRFAQTRLVADETQEPSPPDPQISFPFGGMHLTAGPVTSTWTNRMMESGRNMIKVRYAAGGAALCLGVAVVALLLPSGNDTPNTTPRQTSSTTVAEAKQAAIVEDKTQAQTTPASGTGALALVAADPDSGAQAAPATAVPSATAEAAAAAPAGEGSAQALPVKAAATPSPVLAKPTKGPPAITNIIQAKLAYKNRRISKDTYRNIVNKLESELDMRVRQTKLDYQAGKFSKDEYKRRITALKIRYIGES